MILILLFSTHRLFVCNAGSLADGASLGQNGTEVQEELSILSLLRGRGWNETFEECL